MRPIAAFCATAGVLLLAHATANQISHDRFEITPTAGWHLYARVAPFAWCGDFDPPAGTEALCETTPPDQRPGSDWYLFDAASPSARLFGYIDAGSEADEKLGAFARAAVIGQPKTFLEAVWTDVKAYFFPDAYRWSPGRGGDLDSQLDWTGPAYPEGEASTERWMETFFDPFADEREPGALGFLHDYQRTFRFGAAPLTIATALILLGLLAGPRRNRIAVLVLGVGGLAMFVLPTFSIIYIARYTVPSASLVAAGGAIGLLSLIDVLRTRLRSGWRPIRRIRRVRSTV